MMSLLRKIARNFRGDILEIPGRAIAFFFLVLLPFVPLFTQDPYILKIFIFANIFAIFAASWDLLSGFTGQMNLGHAAFFGIGAYTASLLNIKFGLAPWITIPASTLTSVAMGFIIGFPALRIRGIYLALVTLAFPIILTGIVNAFPDFSGGEAGIYGVAQLSPSVISDFYITFVLMVICALIMWKLTDAKSSLVRLGVRLLAIGEDEIAARAIGINTTRYKMIAFCVSAFFAGFAGGLYAHITRITGPSVFELYFGFQPIIWTIFGGIATIGGPIAGVFILYPLLESLRVVPEIRMLIFACIIIVVLFAMPEGITTWFRDKVLEEECPRCKLSNAKWRTNCRACDAPLRLERNKDKKA